MLDVWYEGWDRIVYIILQMVLNVKIFVIYCFVNVCFLFVFMIFYFSDKIKNKQMKNDCN